MQTNALASLCVTTVLALQGCAGQDAFARFTYETPPCHLPPLTDAQVHETVVKAGESFAPAGYPEPIWRVAPFRCVYRYEQSALYVKGKPVPLNTVDGTSVIWVSRDLHIFR